MPPQTATHDAPEAPAVHPSAQTGFAPRPAQAPPPTAQAPQGLLAPRTPSPAPGTGPDAPADSTPATTWAFLALLAAALGWGWAHRDTGDLTPETGTGYWLGIVGASLMLTLVLYPMRKRLRFMRRWGAVRHWFRVHMITGVVAPVLVVYHANFQTGSVNGSVAMAAMLTVAGSGLIGRFVYTKIHYGLYGRRADMIALREDAESAKGALTRRLAFAPQLGHRMTDVETRVLRPRGAFGRAWQMVALGVSLNLGRRSLRRFIRPALRQRAREKGWSRAELKRQRQEVDAFLTAYLASVRRVVEFSFYERLFAMWHVLHFPLFLLLIGAGIVHVIAVHAY
jgi:hypothetical protein